MDETELY